MQFYKDTLEKFPRASMPKRLPLNFTSGEIYKVIVNQLSVVLKYTIF